MAADETMGGRIELAWLCYQCRTRQILKQEELGRLVAERLNLSAPIRQSTVATWFSAKSNPKLDTLYAIAAVLGTTVDWLYKGEGAPNPPAPQRDLTIDPVETRQQMRERLAREAADEEKRAG